MKKLLYISLFLPLVAQATTEKPVSKHEIFLRSPLSLHGSAEYDYSFYLGGGYNYTLKDWLQLGGTAGIGYATDSVGFLAEMGVGPTFNWLYDGNFNTALFLSTSLGMRYQTGQNGTTRGYFTAEVGKRFELFSGILYRPTIGITAFTEGSPVTNVMPLSFSLTF